MLHQKGTGKLLIGFYHSHQGYLISFPPYLYLKILNKPTEAIIIAQVQYFNASVDIIWKTKN